MYSCWCAVSNELLTVCVTAAALYATQRAIKKEQAWVVSQVTTTSQRLQRSKAAGTKQQQDDSSSSTGTSECATAAVTRLPAGGASVSSDQGWTQSSSSSSLDSPLPSEAGLLEQLQLQQQLDDLLRQMEQLLLREHDQHFMLLWCCTKMPSSIRVFMEVRHNSVLQYCVCLGVPACLPLSCIVDQRC